VVSEFSHSIARLSKTLPANVCVVIPLSSGLDINLLDRYGRTPLYITSLLGGETLVEEFADKMSQKEIGKIDTVST
jgi:hypothetical protein